MNHSAFEQAWALPLNGPAESLAEGDCTTAMAGERPFVVLLNRNADDIATFLIKNALVPDVLLKPLLMEDTRPRCEAINEGVLLNLRGMNLNPGAELGEMLSARMWITDKFIVIMHAHKIMALAEIIQNFKDGHGPVSIGDFIVTFADRLTERMMPEVQQIEEQIDTLEEQLDDDDAFTVDNGHLRNELARIRPGITALKRFIAPQKDALARLSILPAPWLTDVDRINLRHIVDIVTRLVEDLETLRERSALIKDAIQQKMSDAMAHSMNWLSAVAFVFLPLGFLTGLLGINVGGMPGAETTWAFWCVCALMLVLGVGLWAFMRKKKLL